MTWIIGLGFLVLCIGVARGFSIIGNVNDDENEDW